MKVSRSAVVALAAALGLVAFVSVQSPRSLAQTAFSSRIPIVFERASNESSPPATSVDVTSRAAVRAFYSTNYDRLAVDSSWTGSVAGCTPGTTSAAFKEEVKTRINFFRLMAGVPAITGFTGEYNTKAQAAALMMSANNRLSHFPDTAWTCYSVAGAEAAGSSNLSLGAFGPNAISGQFQDSGANNTFLGHRRWILFPKTQNMGTGDVPFNGNNNASNALWVFDANQLPTRPATRDPFVAWPPNGFVPYQVVFQRWSFSYPDADFTNATVTVSSGGNTLAATIINPAGGNPNNGYGENTLAWTLPGVSSFQPTGGDVIYSVTVGNVLINGVPQQFQYTVRVIDPAN